MVGDGVAWTCASCRGDPGVQGTLFQAWALCAQWTWKVEPLHADVQVKEVSSRPAFPRLPYVGS